MSPSCSEREGSEREDWLAPNKNSSEQREIAGVVFVGRHRHQRRATGLGWVGCSAVFNPECAPHNRRGEFDAREPPDKVATATYMLLQLFFLLWCKRFVPPQLISSPGFLQFFFSFSFLSLGQDGTQTGPAAILARCCCIKNSSAKFYAYFEICSRVI